MVDSLGTCTDTVYILMAARARYVGYVYIRTRATFPGCSPMGVSRWIRACNAIYAFATFNFQLIPIVCTDEIYCAARFGCNQRLKYTIERKFFSSSHKVERAIDSNVSLF